MQSYIEAHKILINGPILKFLIYNENLKCAQSYRSWIDSTSSNTKSRYIDIAIKILALVTFSINGYNYVDIRLSLLFIYLYFDRITYIISEDIQINTIGPVSVRSCGQLVKY